MPVPAHLRKGALVSITQESTESSRFVQPDEFIQHQLQRAQSRIQTTDILSALVLSGLLLVGYVLVFTLLDHWVIEGGFRPVTRAVMLLAVLSCCAVLIYRFVFRRMNSAINPLFAAQMLEHGIESSRGSLLTLIDLRNSRHQPTASVRRTLANRAAAGLNQIHLDEVIDRTWLLRGSMALFVITLLMCLYAVFSPKSISILRPLSLAGVDVATRTRLESVLPGNTTITAGSWLQFQTDLSGTLPAEVQVFYTTTDRRFVDEPLTLQAGDDEYRFTAELTGADNRGIRQNLTYYVRAGDAVSQTYSVNVIQPPSAALTRVRYKYPSYMQLPDHSSTDQAISTWEDSQVTLEATATVPLSSAVLQLSDDPQFSGKSEEIRCSIDDLNLRCEWTLSARSDGSFPRYCRIQVTDAEGAQNPDPAVYPVEVRRDQPPVVRLLDPTGDLDVPRNAVIPLLIEAEDPDFLLRNVTLHCTINGQPPLPTEFLMDTATAGPLQKWSGTHELHIDLLRVQPGDVVTCYVEARDNHPPLGNASRSSEIRLQIQQNAAPEQVQEQLRQDREIQQNMMRSRENGTEPSGTPEPGTSAEPTPQQPQQTDPAENPQQTSDANGTGNSNPDSADGNKTGQPAGNGNQQPRSQNASESDTERTDGNQSGDQTSEQSGVATSEQERSPASDDEALQELINQLRKNDELNDLSNPADKQQPTNSDGAQDSSQTRPDSGNQTGESSLQAPDTENPSDSEQNRSQRPAATAADDNPDQMPSRPDPTSADPDASESRTEQNSSDTAAQQPDSNSTPDGQQQTPHESSPEPVGEQQKPEPGATGEQGTDNRKPMPEDGASDAQQSTESNSTGDNKANMSDNKSGDGSSGNQQQQNTSPAAQGDASSGNSETSSGEAGDSSAGSQSQSQNGTGQGMPSGSADGNSGGAAGSGKSSAGESSGSKSGNQPNKSGAADSASQSQGSTGENAGAENTANGSASDNKSQSQQTESGNSENGSTSRNGRKPLDNAAESSSDSQSDQPSADQNDGMNKPGSDSAPSQGSPAGGQDQSAADDASDSADDNAAAQSGQQGKQKSGRQPGQQQAEGGQNQSGGQQQGAAQKGGEGQQGGKGGSGQQSGNGGQGPTGKPGALGGVHTGGGQASSAEMDDSTQDQSEPGKRQPGQNAGGAPAAADVEAEAGVGSAADASKPAQLDGPDPQEVDRAARAANLALRRLRQDLDRGQVNRELLDQLGWTEEQLLEFTERMQQRLLEREENAAKQKELSLSQKSFNEMLRSLDLQSSGSTRIGNSDRDRDRTDTTLRNSVPPSKYREAFEAYQRSLSGAGSRDNPKR